MVSELRATGGRCFFSALKEGEEIKFATDDDNERHSWVQAMYRATGQAHKPVPPKQDSLQKPSGERKLQCLRLASIELPLLEPEKNKKYSIDDCIANDPVKFPHDHLFARLQSLTLNYRLNETVCSLVCPLALTRFLLPIEAILRRAGSHLGRYSYWTSTARDTWSELVIGTCICSVIWSAKPNRETLSIRP